MPDLAGRGALGQKQFKPPKKPRKPLPKQSAKRKAYLASPERGRQSAHGACRKIAVLGLRIAAS